MDQDNEGNPPRYPDPPDLKRVADQRSKMRREKAEREAHGSGPTSRLNRKAGKTAKDIGTYTLIPSLMIAGPLVGYGLGYLVEKKFAIAPWGMVGGVLLGVVAGFRQVILILQRKSDPPAPRH